jgi:hypothetical protein
MKKIYIALFLFLSSHNLGIAQNIIGSFQHFKSRVMGGYRISSTSNLEISKNEQKVISYFVIKTVVDEYNGSIPRTEETSGVIKLINNKYKFIGGSYGESGAYILPNNKMNSKVLISFAPGRGDAMLFDKKVFIDDNIDNNSLNSSLDVTKKNNNTVHDYFDSDFFNKFYRKFEILGDYVDLNEMSFSLSNDKDHIGTIKAIHINNEFKVNNSEIGASNVPAFVEIQINNGHTVYVNFEDKERFKNDKEIMKLFNQFKSGRKINFELYTEGRGVLSQAYFAKLKFL